MQLILFLCFLSLVHHYFVQRDLAISVIEKHLVSRMQTSLTDYFLKQREPLIIGSRPEGSERAQVILINDEARKNFCPDDSKAEISIMDSYQEPGEVRLVNLDSLICLKDEELTGKFVFFGNGENQEQKLAQIEVNDLIY